MISPAGQARALHQVSVESVSTEAFSYLTPETLLAYCQSRLRTLDAQVQVAFRQQGDRSAVSKALSELANSLGKQKSIGEGEGERGLRDEIRDRYDAAIAAAGGPASPVGRQLVDERDRFVKTATGTTNADDKKSVDEGEMQSFTNAVQRIQGDITREGELQMIQLQSLMSQRQTALQMTTNMIAGLGEASRNIAAKIGS